MPECHVTYYTDNRTKKLMWSCSKGLTGTRCIASATRCWRYNCPGASKRPLEDLCLHANCDNSIRAGKGTKYCSLKCKSKESSRRYRIRKKNEQTTANQQVEI